MFDLEEKNSDSFAAANRYAGKITDLTKMITEVTDKGLPQDAFIAAMDKAKEKYSLVFEAFMAGVEHARKNSDAQ